MSHPYYPPIPQPPGQMNTKTSANPSGVQPGAITSTGGLFGTQGQLLVPMFNPTTGKNSLVTLDASNFNTEESCTYAFRQENIKPNYDVSTHKLIVVYRNLGLVTVTFSVTCFIPGITQVVGNQAIQQLGTFETNSLILILGSNAADGKLYTINFDIVTPGQRPQVVISRNANAGPLSIVSVTLIGNADEKVKV